MQAKCSTLAHEPVEQECRFLCQLVVLDEKLLKLVDDQQDARTRRAGCMAVGVQVVDAELSESLAARFQFAIESLQHAQTKFAFAFDRHDASMRQVMDGVRLEVDQVKLDLLRAVKECEIRDERMQER